MRQIINIDTLRKADVLDDPDYAELCEQLDDFIELVVITGQVGKDGEVSGDENILRPRPFSILIPLPYEIKHFPQSLANLATALMKDGVHEPKIITRVSSSIRNAINDSVIKH